MTISNRQVLRSNISVSEWISNNSADTLKKASYLESNFPQIQYDIDNFEDSELLELANQGVFLDGESKDDYLTFSEMRKIFSTLTEVYDVENNLSVFSNRLIGKIMADEGGIIQAAIKIDSLDKKNDIINSFINDIEMFNKHVNLGVVFAKVYQKKFGLEGEVSKHHIEYALVESYVNAKTSRQAAIFALATVNISDSYVVNYEHAKQIFNVWKKGSQFKNEVFSGWIAEQPFAEKDGLKVYNGVWRRNETPAWLLRESKAIVTSPEGEIYIEFFSGACLWDAEVFFERAERHYQKSQKAA